MVLYEATNEVLNAIVYGMDLKPSDRVLSICGSGDQPFAISEYVREVVAIDHDSYQIEYAAKKFENIKKGEYDEFFKVYDTEPYKIKPRTKYFSKKDRLDIIRKKSNIMFLLARLEDMHYFEGFNKVYLSNASSMTNMNPIMEDLDSQLPKNSLVYSTVPIYCRNNLKLDLFLTFMAKLLEFPNHRNYDWSPDVYRKI